MKEASFIERLNNFQKVLDTSKKIVFFGGAGVSTESGIPDFRSKDGLYNQNDVEFDNYNPEYLLSRQCLINDTDVFFEYYRQKLDFRNIKPNIAHFKLAELKKKKDITIITQNIDGLHQKAGSKNVLEIHGTTNHAYCTKCKKEHNTNMIFESNNIPKCECGGIIRPAVTLYQESLPKVFDDAYRVIKEADLLIVAGTSLTVYPAANLLSDFQGEHLVIINNDKTDWDKFADIIFRENIGKVFSNIK